MDAISLKNSLTGRKSECARDGLPGFCQNFRIFYRGFVDQCVRIGPSPTLGQMQCITDEPSSGPRDPHLRVESDDVHYQRLSFPMSYRVSVVLRFRILLVGPPVRVDDAKCRFLFGKQDKLAGCLDDPYRVGGSQAEA